VTRELILHPTTVTVYDQMPFVRSDVVMRAWDQGRQDIIPLWRIDRCPATCDLERLFEHTHVWCATIGGPRVTTVMRCYLDDSVPAQEFADYCWRLPKAYIGVPPAVTS